MITLIKILFFGGASLLTPKLVDLVDSTTLIQLAEPISATIAAKDNTNMKTANVIADRRRVSNITNLKSPKRARGG